MCGLIRFPRCWRRLRLVSPSSRVESLSGTPNFPRRRLLDRVRSGPLRQHRRGVTLDCSPTRSQPRLQLGPVAGRWPLRPVPCSVLPPITFNPSPAALRNMVQLHHNGAVPPRSSVGPIPNRALPRQEARGPQGQLLENATRTVTLFIRSRPGTSLLIAAATGGIAALFIKRNR